MRTVVIGAGVVGLSVAFELAHAGETTILVDSGNVGEQASAGNAGWVTPFLSVPRAAPGVLQDALKSLLRPESAVRISPHIDLGFLSWSAAFLKASRARPSASAARALQKLASQARNSFESLRERGVQFDEYRRGLVVAFKKHDNMTGYLELVRTMRSMGYEGSVKAYRGPEAQKLEPALSSRLAGALHLEDEGHVRPETLVGGLAAALRESGGTISEKDPVTKIVPLHNCWSVRFQSGIEIIADRVVIAAGVSSRVLMKPLGLRVPLEAAKGVSATYSGAGTAPKYPLKLYEDMVACSPFGNSLRFSGTFDIGSRNTEVSQKRLGMVVRQGRSYLEDWEPASLEFEWAGHRPTSSDDLPIIGSVTGYSGLYLATGHGTLGITLGPLTGKLLVKEILSGDPIDELAPFRLNRFR